VLRAAGLVGLGVLGGCSRAPPRAFDGGFVGSDPARGHRLRDGTAGAVADGPVRRVGVLVVGGGIAGLAALRALHRAGVDDAHLLELEDRPGGHARGHAIGGLACPLGAHYLPLPGPQAVELSEWLHEIGLLKSEFGRQVADERHLCNSPQERLFIDGAWHEGLVPDPSVFVGPDTPALAREYRRFAQAVDRARRDLGFALPSDRAPWTPAHAALDAQTFAAWLDGQGLRHPALRWYLDYCCRDDYGAGAADVSAWAGLHYFASRHGFTAPGDDGAEAREPVFTWPEGNAWLVERLARGAADRLHAGRVVTAVTPEGLRDAGVRVDAWHVGAERAERWQARRVVLAVPVFVARRLLAGAAADPLTTALTQAAAVMRQAPWLVANLHLKAPLAERLGAPPAWDNVVYGDATLGYVDATHQLPRSVPGETILTAYWALGGRAAAGALGLAVPQGDLRAALLADGWDTWAARVLRPLATVHADLPGKLARMDIARHGHAMSIPVPGVRGHPALAALRTAAGWDDRVRLAHADLAGYSVFEEAFTLGDRAGRWAAGRG
jgi:predicted NAD/FAD-dependent oxidoreductase